VTTTAIFLLPMQRIQRAYFVEKDGTGIEKDGTGIERNGTGMTRGGIR
jgi:hypothetical protein